MVSFSNSSRLPAVAGAMVVMPVMFPPGRARLSTSPSATGSLETIKTMGIVLVTFLKARASAVEGAFKEAVKARSAALAVTSSPFINFYEKRITDLAAKYRLPAIFDRGEFVARGGLMSYAHDQVEPYRRAAAMVEKILKGAKPADMPVEQPTKFEFVINLKAAKQIGLTIPPNVLARADKVIK